MSRSLILSLLNITFAHLCLILQLSPSGPSSHIYLSNRAAAHCYLTSYELAVADCERCIELSPAYIKGYTRLGVAHFAMKNYEAAIEAYKKCIDLEPKVKAHKDALTQAKQKALEFKGQSGGTPAAGGDNFDMASLAAAMGKGGGGGGGLNGMMQNPAVMKAAQDMMGGGKVNIKTNLNKNIYLLN